MNELEGFEREKSFWLHPPFMAIVNKTDQIFYSNLYNDITVQQYFSKDSRMNL